MAQKVQKPVNKMGKPSSKPTGKKPMPKKDKC
jgi:hypothetical protein